MSRDVFRTCPNRVVVAFLMLISVFMRINALEIGLDYNMKPQSEHWLNLRATAILRGFSGSPSLLDEIRIGVSINNGFYIPDFDENPGPTYRAPGDDETDADVRLNGMVTSITISVDWLFISGSFDPNRRFGFYLGPGIYASFPGYFEIGPQLTAGVTMRITSSRTGMGTLFLETIPNLGIELNTGRIVWETGAALGFRFRFGAGR